MITIHYYGWATAKNIQWRKELDKFIMRVVEAGIYVQSRKRHTGFKWSHCRDSKESKSHRLAMSHVAICWWVLGVGLGLAITAFAFEMLVSTKSEMKKLWLNKELNNAVTDYS